MAKTSSASSSSPSSDRASFTALLLALVFPAICGCAYTRIALSGKRSDIPARQDDPPLHVVDFIVENRGSPTTAQGRSIPDVGRILASVEPKWFSTGEESIPIVVKVRTDLASSVGMTPGDSAFWSNFVGALTLSTIPMYYHTDIRLGVFIQLGPGEWSDSAMIPGREDTMLFNPASALLFSWFLSERSGWQRGAGMGCDLLPHLREGSGESGINKGFTALLTERIVEEWNSLSFAERRKARENPVAIRKKHELQPWTDEGGTATPIQMPVEPKPSSVSSPTLVSSSYDKLSGRASISFRRNGTEPLAALRWVRETVAPKIIGSAKIRILREETRPSGVTTIEFEVLP